MRTRISLLQPSAILRRSSILRGEVPERNRFSISPPTVNKAVLSRFGKETSFDSFLNYFRELKPSLRTNASSIVSDSLGPRDAVTIVKTSTCHKEIFSSFSLLPGCSESIKNLPFVHLIGSRLFSTNADVPSSESVSTNTNISQNFGGGDEFPSEEIKEAFEYLCGYKGNVQFSLSRWLQRSFCVFVGKYLCPSTFAPDPQSNSSFYSDISAGAKQALNVVSESLAAGDIEALDDCVDPKLFRQLKNSLETFEKRKLKLDIAVLDIVATQVDNVLIVVGVRRNQLLLPRSKYVHSALGQHIVTAGPSSENETVENTSDAESTKTIIQAFDDPWESNKRAERSSRQVLSYNALQDAFSNGGVTRTDVLALVKQRTCLKDDSGQVILGSDIPTTALHVLRFEMPLTPSDSSSSAPIVSGGDWKLVDTNTVLKGNYPVDTKGLSNVYTY